MRVPPAQACTRSVQYSFDRSQTRHGGGRTLSRLARGLPCKGRRAPRGLSERRRPHAASARARVAVPALAAGLLLRHHEDAYQCVRTCPGARGWGELWAAGAVPFRAQKWHRMSWWCAARASHGQRPATAGLCQSWWTKSCRTLSNQWRKLCPPIGASFRSSRDSVCAMRGLKSRWYLHSSGEHTVAHGR